MLVFSEETSVTTSCAGTRVPDCSGCNVHLHNGENFLSDFSEGEVVPVHAMEAWRERYSSIHFLPWH
jgi:hypothetical protein